MTVLSWFESYGSEKYIDGFDMQRLDVDQAYLNTSNELTSNYNLHYKFIDCDKCNFRQATNFARDINNKSFILENVPRIVYRLIRNQSEEFTCEFGEDFGEFGIYNLELVGNSCELQIIKEPVSISFPVLTVFLIYLAISSCVCGFFWIYDKYIKNKTETTDEGVGKKARIASLDTFRGISIVVMIFVNYGAGSYAIIDHAVWNGLHLADLVFPWFMWIMGVCIPISLKSSFRKNLSNKSIFSNILKRSIKLFCLGVFLGSGTNLEWLRIFGVLARFAIAYFVTANLYTFLCIRETVEYKNKFLKYVKDIHLLSKAWIVTLLILLIYLLIIFLLVEDGCPTGYFGPGGLHDGGKHWNCIGGATGYIDRLILKKHMFRYPSAKRIFNSGPFDPEGILGCLPSVVQVFIGVQAGVTLQSFETHKSRLLRWIGWGSILGLAGGVLCGFSQNDGIIPVNKNLWSISFVMVTSCLAFFLLSLCYYVIDVKHWWSGKPLLFAGMNAILMYIGHNMTYSNFPIIWTIPVEYGQNTHFFRLLQNLWGAGFWLVVSYILYRKKYFFNL